MTRARTIAHGAACNGLSDRIMPQRIESTPHPGARVAPFRFVR
jgi:hypothetical protein